MVRDVGVQGGDIHMAESVCSGGSLTSWSYWRKPVASWRKLVVCVVWFKAVSMSPDISSVRVLWRDMMGLPGKHVESGVVCEG